MFLEEKIQYQDLKFNNHLLILNLIGDLELNLLMTEDILNLAKVPTTLIMISEDLDSLVTISIIILTTDLIKIILMTTDNLGQNQEVSHLILMSLEIGLTRGPDLSLSNLNHLTTRIILAQHDLLKTIKGLNQRDSNNSINKTHSPQTILEDLVLELKLQDKISLTRVNLTDLTDNLLVQLLQTAHHSLHKYQIDLTFIPTNNHLKDLLSSSTMITLTSDSQDST